MKGKAPGGSGQGRRANLKCEICFFYNSFCHEYEVACRLNFLEALIGPDFEPDLSLRLDGALMDLEALRGGPVHVGVVVRRVMADLARQRPDYLEGNHG